MPDDKRHSKERRGGEQKHRSRNIKKESQSADASSEDDELSQEHKEVLSDIETCMRKRLKEKMLSRHVSELKREGSDKESSRVSSPPPSPDERDERKRRKVKSENNADSDESSAKLRKHKHRKSDDNKTEKAKHRKDGRHERDRDRENQHLNVKQEEDVVERHMKWDVAAIAENRPARDLDTASTITNASATTIDSSTSEVSKEEPNFGLSGKLTEYTNTYNGVVIKYNEPAEARKPNTRWRLYPFKGEEGLEMLQIHRQSAYLLGRDRQIADIPIDHPSCSKQHAVLQFRLVEHTRPDGSRGRRVKPYIIDLETTNGTFINNNKVEARRYVELREKDVLKFGFSSRDYVILHEKSQDDESDEEPDEAPVQVKKKEEKE